MGKKEFELDDQLKVTQLAPVTFDASLRDIFTPLICGGTVCIPEDPIRSNIHKLIQWIEKAEISLIHCVPSFFRTLMKALENQSAPQSAMPQLQYILMAGEALYGRDIIQWMDLMGDRISLVNLYGPSETTLIKTFYPIKERPSIPHKMIPVGKPISNTSVLILKENRLCGIGEMGEICIKTPFMTKGYYQDPQLTAKSFVQNPLNDQPDIIYKTGDLGRYLPDRTIEFIGRGDSQVKVNGNRVELAEIEKNLLRHKAIDQTVAMVLKNQDNENTLACYYTEKQEISTEAIRQFLVDQLPSYMIPAFFIKLDAFPLTITGKLDPKSLPKPEELLYESIKYEPPTNETEEKLAAIWADVLELKQVGINNSFFEIGGHSLKALRVVSRIYKEFTVDISLKDFFENATIKKLAQRINCSEKQPFSQIQPVGEKAYYDLSHAQRRMWIMDQMDGGSIAYNCFEAILIDGHLHVSLLKKAIETAIQRHESLRTTFELFEGEPKQIIHQKGDCLFHETDLSQNQYRPDSIEEQINETAKIDAIKPFNLSTGPLMRIHLLKISHTQCALLFSIHHIISDAWSLDILSKEVLTLYESFVNGDHKHLAPLRIQYKDYANWQNHLFSSQQINRYQSYWHHKLSGELPVLNLPIDYPRPPVQTFNGKTISFEFDSALTKGLFELSASCDVTIFMCIHALLKALLFRYTGQEDIIIGAPIAGREHPDLDNQIGFYVNILALRDNIQKNDSFKDLLSKVKQTTTEAYEHQLYPFDRLVDEIDIKNDISRPPIFSVAMTFYENPQGAYETKTLNISSIATEINVSKYDFILTFTEIKGCLEFNINFNSDLFHENTIRRLARHLEVISNSVINNPDHSITTLDILDPLEKDKILFEFNDTHCEYPKNKNMIQIFKDIVCKYPDNTAVIYEDKHISYQELDRYSDLLAGYLITTNIQHEEIVGVFIDKSELLVISFLGILKAGAAYLPIDPEYPVERIRHIIEDSQCNIIFTETKHQSKLKDLKLHIQNIKHILNKEQYIDNIENINKNPITPETLSYIIYTSGSTGKPKGSMNIHKGPVNMSLDQIRSFGITESDHILQFASISFDASIYEMCMALFSGAAITIASNERINDPEQFMQYLIDKNVTVATLPPVYLSTLDREKMKALKTIITAGEAAMVQDAVYYSNHLQYINAYGPSEASVCISFHRVHPERQYHTGIPIGKPISNTKIYILDELLQPVPVGIPGEICVSGAGLGRGYLNRENLTKENLFPILFIVMKGFIKQVILENGKWMEILNF
ncbi:MAG: amino acid adenylation domain-containing protein [Candidatus Magnetoglobus multicellularis str. Araruama]|uniref:Amino acid adenylation domain-containing protein n=1 Tax=Candidatus Magnetoglobus multicellularis str. Araruama TaxID=890399 RepID=A0A1V1PFP9_9BACT|nr:MAG: amino acid adenylation domain-containing protein [Candidatus Magnetoglobus multicellularis str. Araruama]